MPSLKAYEMSRSEFITLVIKCIKLLIIKGRYGQAVVVVVLRNMTV